MNFDIGTWWHWLFVAAATLGSACNACRVFFEEFAASHNPLFSPIVQFWYELAGSMAGWMALWALLPFVMECSAGDCRLVASFPHILLLLVAVLGIFGQIPRHIDRTVAGLGELYSRLTGR